MNEIWSLLVQSPHFTSDKETDPHKDYKVVKDQPVNGRMAELRSDTCHAWLIPRLDPFLLGGGGTPAAGRSSQARDSNPHHSSDNAGSFNHQATRELCKDSVLTAWLLIAPGSPRPRSLVVTPCCWLVTLWIPS